VFVPHDWWETNHIFFCTSRVIVPSHIHSYFLCSLSSVIFKFLVEWKINTLVEWMIFWSKIDSCKRVFFFLHFCDYFTISFCFFKMVTFNNSVVNTFCCLRTFIFFKVISIFENNKCWKALNLILISQLFVFISINFSNVEHWWM